MNETEFRELADVAFERLDAALEACVVDVDWTQVGSGVVELEFGDGSKIVVNRHASAQEIWVAARSGGFHFRWDGCAWRDTRDGRELFEALSALASLQAGEPVSLV